MEWIREKIGLLVFFLLFVATQLFGQGMRGVYGGSFGEEKGQKERGSNVRPMISSSSAADRPS